MLKVAVRNLISNTSKSMGLRSARAKEIELRQAEEQRVREESVRLEERTRIAQELHDTLLQSFSGASMQLGVAMNSLRSDSLFKPKLVQILELMEQGLEEGRNAIQGLRGPDSGTSDMVLALSRVRQEVAVQPDVGFRISVAGREQPILSAIQQEIYRIGKEALVNAFCHSRAQQVELELEYTERELRMRVCDDGCGIDPQVLHSGREGHWGLVGMHERANLMGANLEVRSKLDSGTGIELTIPASIAYATSTIRGCYLGHEEADRGLKA